MWCYTIPPLLLNMTLTGSFIILFVLLARLALKKAPKIYSYALWAVVLFRLLCPVSFSAPVSLLGALEAPAATQSHTVEYISPTIVHDAYPSVDIPVTTIDNVINDTLPQGLEQTVADPLEAPAAAATAVWLFGMGAMAAYSLISLAFLRRKLVGAVLLHGNVYLADHIDSPFVMGLFRPRIYLPSSLSKAEQGYILLHELHHIRRFDHIWKLLGFMALCIHWFNPLVWLSFVLAAKDMEMSCDEAVLKQMGPDIRPDYSASLLSLATGRRIIAGTPLAFGEGDTKSRIKNALRWREAPAWVKLLCATACSVVIALCAANPAAEDTTAPEPFGHTYRVAEVLYDAPPFSFTYTPETAPVVSLSADYALNIREGNSWQYAGTFTDSSGLWVGDSFENLFYDGEPSGWKEELTPASIRKNNKSVWKLSTSDTPAASLYYLMLQKNGTLLLAQGKTAGTDPNDKDYIRWIFQLKRANYVECSTYQDGLIDDLGDLGWYPNGFFHDYDDYPTSTIYGSGSLGFTVENAGETLTVEERYYAHRGEDDVFIEKRIHTLYPAIDGVFYLPVERRNNYDEYATYHVAHDVGKYIVRVNFPFQADTTNVTTDQVEAMFSAENPEAVILDSVLAYDGKYEVVGVVLYQEQANMLHLAYVNQDGWSQTVGLGSEETPLSASDAPELTYLGNGTVTWLCGTGEGLTRAQMDFSISGSNTHFTCSTQPTGNQASEAGSIPSAPLVSAINEVLWENFFHNNTMNACSRTHFVILDTRELFHVPALVSGDSSCGKLTVVDLMALGMDFQVEDAALVPIREKALKMTLTFEEQDGAYILVESQQEETDLGDYDASLRQSCYDQAAVYFGIA